MPPILSSASSRTSRSRRLGGEDAPLPVAAATPSAASRDGEDHRRLRGANGQPGPPDGYDLPPADGGGRYEVAGINERYNKTVCDELVALIQAARQDEALQRAAALHRRQHRHRRATGRQYAAVEFYLRDCVFNRGARRGRVDPAEGGRGRYRSRRSGRIRWRPSRARPRRPLDLLDDLRQSREAYERLRRDESSPFWKGLVNRWNNALAAAKTFLPGGSRPSAATGSPRANRSGAHAAK